ncbi:MAG: hypothetical protein ACJASG_001166 [Oleiphilaceae bacterium]|jgi:hypothetical protein
MAIAYYLDLFRISIAEETKYHMKLHEWRKKRVWTISLHLLTQPYFFVLTGSC